MDDFVELATGHSSTIRVLKTMHPRARRLRLSVTPHGARVSYPRGTHPAQIDAFLRENSGWLERKLAELCVPRGGPRTLRVGVATPLLLRGSRVELTWHASDVAYVEVRGRELQLHVPRPFTTALPVARNLLAAFLETQLRHDLPRLLAQAGARLGAAPTGVRIKPLKSLWGSLDSHNRITLDLALALAPPAALRYVVTHEMCHLKVRSHSARFWAWVGELMPGYLSQRDWLRQHGAILKAEMDRLRAPELPRARHAPRDPCQPNPGTTNGHLPRPPTRSSVDPPGAAAHPAGRRPTPARPQRPAGSVTRPSRPARSARAPQATPRVPAASGRGRRHRPAPGRT